MSKTLDDVRYCECCDVYFVWACECDPDARALSFKEALCRRMIMRAVFSKPSENLAVSGMKFDEVYKLLEPFFGREVLERVASRLMEESKP